MIVPINFDFDDRKIEFCMNLDKSVPAEYAVLFYLDHGEVCEPECVHLMLRALKEGDVAVDGGANIGFFTLLMSKLVGPTGTVFAFEPSQDSIDRLKANLALNDCRNVLVIEQALWWQDARLNFFTFPDSGFNSITRPIPGGKTCEVPATTLDAELSATARDARLIKLDIEGAELEALKGARLQLNKGALVLTELNTQALERAGSSVEQIRKELKGKECYGLSNTGHFPLHFPHDVELMPTRANTNVLFCRPDQLKELWPQAWY